MRLLSFSIALLLLLIGGLLPELEVASSVQTSEICSKYAGNPVLVPGSAGQWDSLTPSGGGVGRTSVLFNGTTYLMWYSSLGNIAGIGLATSADGVRWAKAGAPVLPPRASGSWDDFAVYAPSVVWNGTSYLMYFTGENSSGAFRIGLAFSTDGLHWREYAGNPVLVTGPANYDSLYVRYPSVIYENHGYKMWYTGHPPRTPSGTSSNVDLATSDDGVHWTKYLGNPILPSNTQPSSGLVYARTPAIAKLGSPFLMAVEIEFGRISYATSNDGISWSVGGTLLLNESVGSAWDAQTSFPSVIWAGNRILLWYTGDNGTNSATFAVGFATCPLIVVNSVMSTVSTVTSSAQITITKTSITTQTLTQVVESPESPELEVAIVAFAISFAVAVALLVIQRARHRP